MYLRDVMSSLTSDKVSASSTWRTERSHTDLDKSSSSSDCWDSSTLTGSSGTQDEWELLRLSDKKSQDRRIRHHARWFSNITHQEHWYFPQRSFSDSNQKDVVIRSSVKSVSSLRVRDWRRTAGVQRRSKSVTAKVSRRHWHVWSGVFLVSYCPWNTTTLKNRLPSVIITQSRLLLFDKSVRPSHLDVTLKMTVDPLRSPNRFQRT